MTPVRETTFRCVAAGVIASCVSPFMVPLMALKCDRDSDRDTKSDSFEAIVATIDLCVDGKSA
jgi:hypothetical protein